MINKLTKAKQILKKYKQEHLLRFYDELSDDKKDALLTQILETDFDKILTLYKNSLKPSKSNLDTLSPLPHLEKDKLSQEELDYYIKIGEEALKSGSVAVITMAGGQGSRLGYNGPKGTYELLFESKSIKKSLFQIMCEDIKRLNNKYNITLSWYIMTSNENNKQTQKYFEEHNFWDYPKESIKFFVQGQLPLVDTQGKLILDETYHIKEASNGNGNVFNAMKKSGIIKELEKNNVKWVCFGGIDNILFKNADPLLIGLAISKKYEIASKSVFKEEPLDKVAVFCKKLNRPNILNYEDIDLELSNSKFENGMYKYRESNIISHLMSLKAVKRISKVNLPYHRAFRKNSFVNSEGMKEVPDKPNTYKFENFIFDAFTFYNDMLLIRVDAHQEFAPIKDFTGIYNPDTAKEKYIKYWGEDNI